MPDPLNLPEPELTDEYWRCIRKMPHHSRARAKALLQVQKRTLREAGQNLQVYRCPYCRAWHIGNRSRRS